MSFSQIRQVYRSNRLTSPFLCAIFVLVYQGLDVEWIFTEIQIDEINKVIQKMRKEGWRFFCIIHSTPYEPRTYPSLVTAKLKFLIGLREQWIVVNFKGEVWRMPNDNSN